MDTLIKLTVPNYVYQFYHDASVHVAGRSTEDIMADALCAYAGLLNDTVGKQLRETLSEAENRE